MARGVFSTSNYLLSAGAPVSGVPMSMGCWVKLTSAAGNLTMMGVNRGGVGSDMYRLMITGGQVQASHFDTDASDASAGAPPLNEWYHHGGVFASNTSRIAFKNGVPGTEITSTQVALVGLDEVMIGIINHSSFLQPLATGLIAECAVWNVALTTAEMAILALGVSPLMVRPGSLVWYAPLIRSAFDRFGQSIAETGTVPVADDHPRIIYQTNQIVMPGIAAAAVDPGGHGGNDIASRMQNMRPALHPLIIPFLDDEELERLLQEGII